MAPVEPLQILVIDDDKHLAETIAESLERRGHACTVVTGGKAGVAKLEQESFDVVLTDLRMADLHGLEVVERCRQLRPDAEVFVITGVRRREDRRRSDEARGVALPAEADRPRRTARRRGQVRRARSHRARPAPPDRREVRFRGRHRQQPEDAPRPAPLEGVCSVARVGADSGRERHRQGTGGPRAALQQSRAAPDRSSR